MFANNQTDNQKKKEMYVQIVHTAITMPRTSYITYQMLKNIIKINVLKTVIFPIEGKYKNKTLFFKYWRIILKKLNIIKIFFSSVA